MAEEIAAAGPICPWCSTPLSDSAAEQCPYCGAQLVPDADAQLPGVTAIDAEAIVRATRQPAPPRRNRLLSWISGEYDVDLEVPAAPGSVSPPDAAVRREMLRLELAAEVANLQGEAGLVMAEAAEANPPPTEPVTAAPGAETGSDAAAPPSDAEASAAAPRVADAADGADPRLS